MYICSDDSNERFGNSADVFLAATLTKEASFTIIGSPRSGELMYSRFPTPFA
jgi:hypothetical protein